MKIAILGARGIPARYGGFETFAEELATRLVAGGAHDVTVYCEGRGEGGPMEFNGVHLKHISCFPLGPLSTILFDLACLWNARKDYDIVYMLGYGASIFCFLPRLWNTLVLINMDGVEWRRNKWGPVAKLYFKAMEAAAMLMPDHLIADAEAIREHLALRHSSMPPCTVIPYGAPIIQEAPDPSLLRQWGLSPGGYYLVVCRLEPENHVLEIIRGFRNSSSHRKLIILGDRESGTDYVAQLKFEASDPRIKMVGTEYNTMKINALRYHAYAYLHGHSVGGTNPSLLESMGCGAAVLAHDNVFNREVLADAGRYFAAPEELTKLIGQLDEGELPIAEMKKRAWRIVQDKYSWDLMAGVYARLFSDLLAGSAAEQLVSSAEEQ